MSSFGIALRKSVQAGQVKQAVSETLNIPSDGILVFEANNFIDFYTRQVNTPHHTQVEVLTDTSEPFATTINIATDYNLPNISCKDDSISYARKFAAHFGQDVAIGDFTQDSPYRWLIISPDGTVKSVPEDDRYDDEYLHLREDLAQPFEPVSA